MLYKEFLIGTGKKSSESMAYAYEEINRLYMADKLKSQKDCFNYFKHHIDDYIWIDDLDIGHGRKAENHCQVNEIITEEKAKKEIAEEFGFDLNKIKIAGQAYYSVSDLNFIRFMVSGYSWVMEDGELFCVEVKR